MGLPGVCLGCHVCPVVTRYPDVIGYYKKCPSHDLYKFFVYCVNE